MGQAKADQSLQQSAAYQELVQALAETGCPLCTIAQRQARTHIGGILWDSVTDPASRARLDASLGLCGRHSREMLTFAGERLAIAIVQQAVVKAAARQLTESPPPPRQALSDRVRSWLGGKPGQTDPGTPTLAADSAPDSYAEQPQTPAPCPACEVEARTEARVAEVLIRHLKNDLDKPLAAAGGLCRPHLYYCLERSPRSQHTGLIALHQELWAALGGHLGEFIRKRDHRFHHETITDAERDAVERSVQLITGGDPLYPPRKEPRK
ncbi:MAG: DUF6062 family protein [Litorilinea sp.]